MILLTLPSKIETLKTKSACQTSKLLPKPKKVSLSDTFRQPTVKFETETCLFLCQNRTEKPFSLHGCVILTTA